MADGGIVDMLGNAAEIESDRYCTSACPTSPSSVVTSECFRDAPLL